MMERTRWPGVYKRGEKYVAVVSYKTGAGERRQKWISASTLTEVKSKRDELIGEIRKGLKPHAARQTLAWFLTEVWLPEIQATRRPLTRKNYESLVCVHILPALGGLRLAEVNRDRLKAFYRSLPGKATARNCHGVLSSAFTYAVEECGLLAYNPAASVKAPAYERTEARHLDVSEAKRMVGVAQGHRLEGAIILGLVGGLRIAEVCAIQWADLDFDSGRLMVRGSYWGRTKSGKPRGLSLPMAQVAELRRFRIAQAEDLLRLGIRQDDSTPVVVNAWGQAMVPKRLGEAFAAFCAEHNFDATFHSLRHTAAILMLVSGVDPKTAAGRLGHATAAFTMDRYGHYLDSADKAAAEKIAAVLAEDRPSAQNGHVL